MPRKIHFQVVSSTSADEKHPANELNHHGPLINGWQSVRFGPFPQELIVQFENVTRLRRVQLLSHQYLIGRFLTFSFFDIFLSFLFQRRKSNFISAIRVRNKARLMKARVSNVSGRKRKSSAVENCFIVFFFHFDFQVTSNFRATNGRISKLENSNRFTSTPKEIS